MEALCAFYILRAPNWERYWCIRLGHAIATGDYIMFSKFQFFISVASK